MSGALGKKDPLVEKAVRELKRRKDELALAADTRQKALIAFLIRVYLVSKAGMRDPNRHAALLESSGIPYRIDTPHHKQTLRAILKLADVELARQTEHDCYMALEGLDARDVPEHEYFARTFFEGTEEIKGKAITGLARGRAAAISSPRLAAEREEKSVKKDAELDSIFQSIADYGKHKPIGKLAFSDEDLEIKAEYYLTLNFGDSVLISLVVPPHNLRTFVVKYAQS